VDAKSSPVNVHMPPALRTGLYEIRPNCYVLRVEQDASGYATGLTYIDEQGQEQFQPAEIVVLSAFTLANVRLLLTSRGGAHPNGLGNDRGLVGRNYTYQQFVTPVKGYFPGRRFNLFMGNGTTMNAMWDFYGDNFDHANLDFIGGAQLYATSGERDPVTSVNTMPITGQSGDEPPKKWGQAWKDALRQQWNSYADIGLEAESLPYEDQFLDLDPNYVGADGLPLLRLTFNWHDNDRNLYKFMVGKMKEIMQAMGPEVMDSEDEIDNYNIHTYQSTHPSGGAIMGTGPDNSVCNKYGQVWDTPNLFVTGAALFPQNPGANPTDTVAALAYLAGNALRDEYCRAPGRLMA
jgi:gluconate 2-dehydrogenase alpha chain